MSSTLMTKVEEGEFWWGGAVHDGAKMPLSAHSVYAIDLRRELHGGTITATSDIHNTRFIVTLPDAEEKKKAARRKKMAAYRK